VATTAEFSSAHLPLTTGVSCPHPHPPPRQGQPGCKPAHMGCQKPRCALQDADAVRIARCLRCPLWMCCWKRPGCWLRLLLQQGACHGAGQRLQYWGLCWVWCRELGAQTSQTGTLWVSCQHPAGWCCLQVPWQCPAWLDASVLVRRVLHEANVYSSGGMHVVIEQLMCMIIVPWDLRCAHAPLLLRLLPRQAPCGAVPALAWHAVFPATRHKAMAYTRHRCLDP